MQVRHVTYLTRDVKLKSKLKLFQRFLVHRKIKIKKLKKLYIYNNSHALNLCILAIGHKGWGATWPFRRCEWGAEPMNYICNYSPKRKWVIIRVIRHSKYNMAIMRKCMWIPNTATYYFETTIPYIPLRITIEICSHTVVIRLCKKHSNLINHAILSAHMRTCE